MYMHSTYMTVRIRDGCPGWLSGKNPPANAGDTGDVGLILGREEPLEEEMATHSSILAWRVPGTEDGLQSMQLQKAGRD